ncbi:MAG: hypothetical protein ACR2GX_07085 [Candidatus Dormibacteria bacterium]
MLSALLSPRTLEENAASPEVTVVPGHAASGASLAEPLVAPPPRRRWTRWWEYGVVAMYAGVLTAMLPLHEPWFDEAQAWLIARDASPLDLLTTRMRYEGSPPLWHLLLMPAAKLNLPYISINVIAALISVVGVFIFVRRAPFPALVRVLFPFSFFILYQYGVVARSYCLLAPILFLAAHVHSRKLEHPWRWSALLALLSTVSLHGLLIAGSLQLVHLLDLRTRWGELQPALRRRHIIALVGFGVVAAGAAFTMRPAGDLAAAAGWNFDLFHLARTAPLNLTHAIAVNVVSVAVLAVTAWWLQRTRSLLVFILPTTALLLLFSLKYLNVWHEGILFLVWVFALWIAFERDRVAPAATPSPSHRPALAITAAMVITLLIQGNWTINSIRYDAGNNYSASRDVAQYIKDNGLDHRRGAALNYSLVAILPYFPDNIFMNFNQGHRPSYWRWSTSSGLVDDPTTLIATRPEYIVVGVKSSTQKLVCLPGYRVARTFTGGVYWQNRVVEPESYVLLVPAAFGSPTFC